MFNFRRKKIRNCKVLVGSFFWAMDELKREASNKEKNDIIWISQKKLKYFDVIPPDKIQNYLGRECSLLIFDAHEDFMLDSFAAALGTLKGGGELILLTPIWEKWENNNKTAERLTPFPMNKADVGVRFFKRFVDIFNESKYVSIIREDKKNQHLKLTKYQTENKKFFLTLEQKKIIDEIISINNGNERKPLVITANRGRGKTTALAFSILEIIKNKRKNIILLAPFRKNIETFFQIIKRELKECSFNKNYLSYRGSKIFFFTPERYLTENPLCDLLIIDEAAAIPIPILKDLIKSKDKTILSTTVHGYEGSGLGFVNYFTEYLTKFFPKWKRINLKNPIRWHKNDPLENLLNKVFLFESEIFIPKFNYKIEYKYISQDELIGNRSLLKNVFNLLLSAHYQTRPSDLYQLLDAPNLHIIVAKNKSTVVGVALFVEEGGFDSKLANLVCEGKRRPKGHMFLQSLAFHSGLCKAPTLKLLRVMRIAVYESWRHKGIGTKLLDEATTWCNDNYYDLLGAAFGFDSRILNFWKISNFRALRLGYKKDAASGRYSILMAKGISQEGKIFIEKSEREFYKNTLERKSEHNNQLIMELKSQLIKT